jgi:GT2 family glycosyltransferase
MMGNARKLSVIIPTRNRRDDLIACLKTLACQSRLPDNVIIVDASTDLCGDEEQVYTIAVQPIPLRYVPAQRAGLTSQRNQGLTLLDHDITHVLFLDDDVMLADWYCEALLTMFDEKPDAAGIGGWITNPQLPPFGRAFFWFLRMFLIYGGTPGKVLPSGFNTPMFVVQPQSPFQTECLEGGNMCISLEHARDLRFDERYERFAGYAYAEDMDFTYELRKHGTLWVMPLAQMEHKVSPASRSRELRFGICQVFNRAFFVRKHFGLSVYHWLCFLWSMVGIILLNIAMIGRGRSVERLIGNVIGLLITPVELQRLFRSE